jgi:hypothetical protein
MKRGGFSRIVQRFAQPADGGIDAVLEIHERIVGPQLLFQIVPGDDLARSLQQQAEDPYWLAFEAHFSAVLA